MRGRVRPSVTPFDRAAASRSGYPVLFTWISTFPTISLFSFVPKEIVRCRVSNNWTIEKPCNARRSTTFLHALSRQNTTYVTTFDLLYFSCWDFHPAQTRISSAWISCCVGRRNAEACYDDGTRRRKDSDPEIDETWNFHDRAAWRRIPHRSANVLEISTTRCPFLTN